MRKTKTKQKNSRTPPKPTPSPLFSSLPSRITQQFPDLWRSRGHRRQELCARQRLEAMEVEGRGAEQHRAAAVGRGRRRRKSRSRRARRVAAAPLLSGSTSRGAAAAADGRDLRRDRVQGVPDRGSAEGVVEVERGLGGDKLLFLFC